MGHNRAVAGAAAATVVENYRCDLHMMSIGGIDTDGNLLEYKDDETIVARAMLHNSRRSVLLVDHTKFGRVATCRVAHLRDIDTLVTDRPPPAAILSMLEAAGCELIVTPAAP
jgi:DeoR family glycerol-3-phosphate regulon repressor